MAEPVGEIFHGPGGGGDVARIHVSNYPCSYFKLLAELGMASTYDC